MRCTVTVPATSANLGPGFDVFGLALDLCNEVTVDPGAPPGVTWEGEGAGELPTDGTDMVSRTIAAVSRRMDVRVPTFALHGSHAIPLERGLGSSSAAVVAGVVAASALLDLGWDRDRSTVFAAAAELEGHPDNAAPAVFGGFTIAMPDGAVERLDPHPDLRPVAIVPPGRLGTAEARAALSENVRRVDAVFNVAHAALAVRAFTEDPSLLARALDDRLHEEVRLRMADLTDVARRLRAAGIPVCVSGAGPTLLAFEQDGTSLTDDLLEEPGWRIVRPGVRTSGFAVDRDDG